MFINDFFHTQNSNSRSLIKNGTTLSVAPHLIMVKIHKLFYQLLKYLVSNLEVDYLFLKKQRFQNVFISLSCM